MPEIAKIARPVERLMGRGQAVSALRAMAAQQIWVTGHAGTGKTCLALEFLAVTGRPSAWLRLDVADVDPGYFFGYLAAAIEHSGIAPGWQAPALVSEHLPRTRAYLRLFARTLASHIRPSSCLVLDDAHECQQADFFTELLDLLADELPADVSVLVLSRSSPPAGCARLRVHGALQVADSGLLMLSLDETQTLLRLHGVEDAAVLADQVFRFSGGWAAGVTIAASVLKHRPQADLHAGGSLREMLDRYISDEVFSSLDPAEQDALATVCWLPCIHPYCRAMPADAPLRDVVERLAAENTLVHRYANEQYVLHPMLLSFLQGWAQRSLSDEQRQARISRCIDMLVLNGDPDAAITLAIGQLMHERARELILRIAPEFIQKARHQTLQRWINAIPVPQRDAQLWYWLGLAQAGDARQARESLLVALDMFERAGDGVRRIMTLSAIINTNLFDGLATRLSRSDLCNETAYESVADPGVRAHLVFSVGMTLVSTEPHRADWPVWERRALDALHWDIGSTEKVQLALMLAKHYFFSGRHQQLRDLCLMIDAAPERNDLPLYARCLVQLIQLYGVAVGTSARVEEACEQSQRCTNETGIAVMESHYALLNATIWLTRGQPGKAEALLDETADTGWFAKDQPLARLCILRAWVACWQNDLGRAIENARRAAEIARHAGSVPTRTMALLAQALAGTLADPGSHAAWTGQLRQQAVQHSYPCLEVHADLLDAWGLLRPDAARQDTQAIALLVQRALRRWAGTGTEVLLLGVPAVLGPVCEFALRHDIESSMALRLVKRHGLIPSGDPPPQWPWRVRIRCIGAFSLDIDGQGYRPERKAKHKQLDLLKAIAVNAPRPQPAPLIAARLWPEAEPDVALRNLHTTLSRLRQLIGADAVQMEQGMLWFNPMVCWIDTVQLGKHLDDLDTAIALGTADPAAAQRAAARVLALHDAPLLAADNAPWIAQAREAKRKRVTRLVARAARVLQLAGQPDEAVGLVERTLEVDPESESAMRALLELHAC